jgi:peptidoglycan/xylan/chitin deacetylase (PgdA/CDA1 family)
MGRRVFLALGAMALIEGCVSDGVPPAIGKAPLPTGPPRGSHTYEPSHDLMPTPDASAWQIPTPATPVPDVCPTVPGIVQRPGGPQFYLPCSGTNIALTIDDGPDPVWTPQILAVLAQHKVPATFCVIGSKAAARPDLVAAVAAGGHHIANHTFTHPNLARLPASEVHAEIDRATEAISRASGHRPTLFRAPGGTWSPIALAACADRGMRPLDWSVDPRDWSRPGTRHIVEVILTKTRPGSIILEHDGGGNRQQTLDALRIVLPRLIDAGYHFTQP